MNSNSFDKSESVFDNSQSVFRKYLDENKGLFEEAYERNNFRDKLLQVNSIPIPNSILDYNKKLEEYAEAARKENQERYEREVENNENLKNLVGYNNEIAQYNKELVRLNEKILTKVNSLDDTLFFLFQSFKDKYDSDQKLGQEHNALLLELITIIESKDKGKITEFFDKVPVPLGVGLLVEYFKMRLGLS